MKAILKLPAVRPANAAKYTDLLAGCERALELLLTQRGKPCAEIERVHADDPQYVLAHCLRAAFIVRTDDTGARFQSCRERARDQGGLQKKRRSCLSSRSCGRWARTPVIFSDDTWVRPAVQSRVGPTRETALRIDSLGAGQPFWVAALQPPKRDRGIRSNVRDCLIHADDTSVI
jgi:hypothetical protein